MKKYVLRVDCSDDKGLIYKICEVIFKFDFNISTNYEFVDKEYKKFFFRAVIDSTKDVDIDSFKKDLKAVLPVNSHIYFSLKSKKNIAILATKEAHCLGDLLIKHYSGELNADIKCVISNHDSLRGLVEKFNIPYFFIDASNLQRLDHEEKITKKLLEFELDCIILAKYMRILSPEFVSKFERKIINIHHSFLPAFIGANPYKQAHERGVKLIGATAHFVNNNLDEGPIIAQDIVRVNHEMSPQDMKEAGRYIEKSVLSKAVDLFLNDRIFVYKNKTVVF